MQPFNMRMPSIKLLAPLCLLFMLLSFQQSFAQNDKARIEWRKFNFLWLDPIWKYQSGVLKPGYTDPQFDDQSWQTVRGDSIASLLSDKSKWPGVGVFRKKFNVPDSLRGKRAELILMEQFCASEIYLDGKLLAQFGKVGGSAKEELVKIIIIPQNPVQIELDDQPSHVIAVYYSNHSKEVTRVGGEGFGIILSPVDSPIGYTKDSFPHPYISLCIILTFCLFFWFVYGFYPHRLASLISALYIANFSLIFAGGVIAQSTNDVNYFIFGNCLWRIGFACNPGWNLLFMYAIYYGRLPKRAWIVAGLMTIGLCIAIFSTVFPFPIIISIIALFQLEAWRIIILGLRKKRTGFWILAIGFFISLSGSLVAISDVFNFFPWYITVTQTVLAIVTDFSFPLTLALHFAWEFGSANRDLQQQLASVNDLSRKNLEQEKEKQQILATQNETLEQQVTERTSEVVAQHKEIEKQRDQVTNTLEELRGMQKQLIQSEKMASLGELTAGIAHEIQNPLNFVNNFSEVNTELIDEMKKEIDAGNIQQIKSIASDLEQNTEKITHHGKRADAIVKGMLLHSRKSIGEKESININALTDEYLRMSYHGLRAKNRSFNASMKSDYDESIGNIQIIPQDIGRVLLNLFTNAFYAITEKKKDAGAEYNPTVYVSTKKLDDGIEIRVKDNGMGIPQKVLDKIFQPFFTTKPTGEGTGLGLSLSYDIIKAHGGTLKVEDQEKTNSSESHEGAEFVVVLPK